MGNGASNRHPHQQVQTPEPDILLSTRSSRSRPPPFHPRSRSFRPPPPSFRRPPTPFHPRPPSFRPPPPSFRFSSPSARNPRPSSEEYTYSPPWNGPPVHYSRLPRQASYHSSRSMTEEYPSETESNETQYVDNMNNNYDVESLNSFNSDAVNDDVISYRSDMRTPSSDESTVTQLQLPIRQIAIEKSQFLECPSLTLAKEFVHSLNWPQSLFDNSQDRCYCTNCYPTYYDDVVLTGDAEYVIPRGWVRIGLRVDPIINDEHDIWNKWIVTFHGTTKLAARSILTHRHFYLPGDKLIDGTILGIRDGHIPNKKFIYTSPTIAYSSSPIYSPKNDFQSRTSNIRYEAQIVLQCRQEPKSFKVQGQTIGADSYDICPFIPNEKIEYYTDVRSSIVAYGLLVRFRQKYRS